MGRNRGFDGGLDVESEGEEIAKNESCVWPVHLNGQSCRSLA